MFIVIVLVGIMFLAVGVLSEVNAKSVPKECKPHSWVLKFEPDKSGYLFCKNCGKIPGDD